MKSRPLNFTRKKSTALLLVAALALPGSLFSACRCLAGIRADSDSQVSGTCCQERATEVCGQMERTLRQSRCCGGCEKVEPQTVVLAGEKNQPTQESPAYQNGLLPLEDDRLNLCRWTGTDSSHSTPLRLHAMFGVWLN